MQKIHTKGITINKKSKVTNSMYRHYKTVKYKKGNKEYKIN